MVLRSVSYFHQETFRYNTLRAFSASKDKNAKDVLFGIQVGAELHDGNPLSWEH